MRSKLYNAKAGIIRLLFTAAMLLPIISYAANPPALAKHWVYEGIISMELFKDGSGVYQGQNISWKVENNRLVIRSAYEAIASNYKLSGSKLILTYNNGISETFLERAEYLRIEAKKKAAEAKAEAAAEAKVKAALKVKTDQIKRGSFTDARNGKTYKTVKIDEQTWMAENLNYEAEGSKCYENKQENCQKYGRLYNWETAMKACPEGWHLPSNMEWKALYSYVTDKYEEGSIYGNVGKYLNAKSGWGDDWNGTDDFWFSALPGGSSSDGSFGGVGDYSYWWGTSEYNTNETTAYLVQIKYNGSFRLVEVNNRDELLSVRCSQNDQAFLVAVKAKAEADSIAAAKAKADSIIAAKAKADSIAALEALKGSFIDSRDKKKYGTIKIGTQTWMAVNLNYKAEDSKCYENEQANCDKYGRLYNWATAMALDQSCYVKKCADQIQPKHKGICPNGWHLPTTAEWNVLMEAVGDRKTAGKYLKATSGWDKDGNSTDRYGFSALPGGSGISSPGMGGTFRGVGDWGYWWSASESDRGRGSAYYWSMYYDYEYVIKDNSNNGVYLFSVRCLKD